MSSPTPCAPVAIVMGSESDWATMVRAANHLDDLGIAYDVKIVSAHRTPQLMVEFATTAAASGYRVIIAGAGGAAHLPGMMASMTPLPVIGVPVQSKALHGMDSLLSIAQMPAGVPVATMAIGEAGAANAGLFAARILGSSDLEIRKAVVHHAEVQRDSVLSKSDPRETAPTASHDTMDN